MPSPKQLKMKEIAAGRETLRKAHQALVGLDRRKFQHLHNKIVNYPGGEPRAGDSKADVDKKLAEMHKAMFEYYNGVVAFKAELTDGQRRAFKDYFGTAQKMIPGMYRELWVLAKREAAARRRP